MPNTPVNTLGTLLPTGFQDILPDDAARLRRVERTFLDTALTQGYREVIPPLAEFDQGHSENSEEGRASPAFHVMDPASHRMMSLRSDMTVPVARIANERLTESPRPLKLSYAGPVLRTRGEGLHAERQFWQAGAELIGPDDSKADIALLQLADACMTALNVRNSTVAFSLPALPGWLADALALKSPAIDSFLTALTRKDTSAIGNDAVNALLAPMNNMVDLRHALAPFILPDTSSNLLDRLEALFSSCASLSLQPVLDVLDVRGFGYHTGVTFTFFATGQMEELGRGGRYQLPGSGEPATGFSLLLNSVLRATA